jgi:hypothetical protein
MDSISITQSPIKLPDKLPNKLSNKLLIKLQSKSPNKLGAGFFISAPNLLFILYLS